MSPSSDDAARAPRPAPAAPPGGLRETPLGGAARLLLLLAVLLTGATALAYEVAWTRGLVRVLGSTSTTTAVVLAAFVGSLGLGARWGGALADGTRRPLAAYGLLEIGAALWAVLALELAGFLEPTYVSLAEGLGEPVRFGLRVLLALVVVAPGALLLGATLPALVRFWVGSDTEAGRGTAWVYGANTLGAVGGVLVTGFYGIAAHGVRTWLLGAAGTAGAVGVLALLLGGARDRGTARARPSALGRGEEALPLRPALWTAALCGALGLALEVTGFRVLVFFVEGFTATFAAMLAAFIAGLGLGSLLLGPLLTRLRRPDVALGGLLFATGLVLFLELWFVIPELETLVAGVRDRAFAGAVDDADVQLALEATALAGSAALLFLPALLLGATFPLCVRWADLAGQRPGAAVGRVYLANSVGTLIAPFVAVFGLMPLLGVLDVWRLLCVVGLFCGLGLTVHVKAVRTRPGLLSAFWGATILVLVWLVASPSLLGGEDGAQGPAARLVRASHVLHGRSDRRLLDARTDAVTTASVVETAAGERILYTDDFAAAATGRHYRYMRMLGHLPVLLASDPERVMVIAFGTGTTAGAVARHAEVKHIEVVEVSDAVYDLAPYFAQANRNVLADPRTVRVRDDGRNALLLHEPNLDVITLEPLMPYSPAGLPFYTKEFYELARSRLREGGVLCQWLPVHAMPAGLYAAFLRTFFEVFPEGSLWFFEQSTAMIAVKGSPTPLDAFEARAKAVSDDLAAAGFGTPTLLFSAFVASGHKVLGLPAPPSPFRGRVVEDLDPFPEFHPTPRAPLNTTYLQDTLQYLWSLTSPQDLPPGLDASRPEVRRTREGAAHALRARFYEAVAAWSEVAARGAPPGSDARAVGAAQALDAWRAAATYYEEALALLPDDAVLAWRHARAARRVARAQVLGLLDDARKARKEGREAEAEDALRSALAVASSAAALEDGDPVASERGRAAWLRAAVLLHLGRCATAGKVLREAAEALPPGGAEAELVRAAQVAVAAQAEGRRPAHDDRLGTLLRSLPPCREEGLGLLADPLARWREALAATPDARRLRLAADNLVAAARREGVVDDLYRELAGTPRPDGPVPRAVQAGLVARLHPEERALAVLFGDPDPARRATALKEAGRLKLLSRWPLSAARAAKDAEARVREAFALAAGEDGDRGMLYLVVDLLLDPERSVRTAAVAALVPREPTLLEGYDPDAPDEARQQAVEAVRKAWKP